VHSYS
jgi:phosphomevalonate kinase